MGRWKGDIKNFAPNSVKESIERSEKFITNNDPAAFISNDRAEQVRRDTDSQKNFTITLYDIDETILTQLQQLQIQVTDVGKRVAVPIFFGPPERWVSAQRDGFMRDKQGKIILPCMILKRSNSENDSSLMFFNRYLDTQAMKLYSEKNKYTQFNALTGQNAPVNEVYNVVVPKHMILSYHCIVWTAYVEQMNEVMQTIVFNTQDYWGSKNGFRFRVQVDGGYAHNVEISAGDERMVRTEFDLTTHGYILPDTATYLERHKMTTQKRMTPKKFIIGMEVVKTEFDLSQEASNAEKWHNPNYPNLRYDTIIPPPGVSVDTNIQDSSFFPQVIGKESRSRVPHYSLESFQYQLLKTRQVKTGTCPMTHSISTFTQTTNGNMHQFQSLFPLVMMEHRCTGHQEPWNITASFSIFIPAAIGEK